MGIRPPPTQIDAGTLYFVTDTGEIYLDKDDTTRVKMAASDWNSIINKPSTFVPADHKHTAIYRADNTIAYMAYLNANKDTLGWGLQFVDTNGSCAYMYLTSADKNIAPTITVYAPDGVTNDTVLMINSPIYQITTIGAASKTRTAINQTIQFSAWEILKDSVNISDNNNFNDIFQNINTFQINSVMIADSTTVTNYPTGAYSYGQCLTSITSYGPKAQIYIPHIASSGNGIWYRSGWSVDDKAWANILDTSNYNKYVYTKTEINDAFNASRSANTVLAAPNGSNGSASFRKLVTADLPDTYLSLNGGTMNGLLINNTRKVFGHHDCDTDISYNNVGWYNIGYSNLLKDGTSWWEKGQDVLCINNYWGIDIRTMGAAFLRHNGNRIWCYGDSVTGAVWNDYAEYRQCNDKEPGYVVLEDNSGYCNKTSYRLSPFAGVVSDTWGFSQGETETADTNIAVAGRVLVYTSRDRNQYKIGDCVCADKNGTVDIMSRNEIIQYPDRIVGTVSEIPIYKEWGGCKNADRPPIKVNGRIWIKVK